MASDPGDVLAVIMGGGRGTRLSPLTAVRSKPAVPIGGKYRLIDIPISNCINSGIYHIAVLTQFNSVSLHRHISRAYRFDAFHSGWVQIWAAEQTIQSADWYQGTADAVRKQLPEIRATGASHVLILAGDHLYRMDYARMAEYHWEKKADITVAVHPVPREEAGRLGILKVEQDGRISDFVEKPQDPAVVNHFVSRPDPAYPLLGSMGIYLFNVDVLADILTYHPSHTDFGIDIIPHAVHSHSVFGLAHEGYWRDIGTIRAYYETNLMLAAHDSPFNFYDPKLPIYTHEAVLPGSIIEESMLTDVLIAEGCRVQKARIEHSVVGIRSQVGAGTRVAHSVLNGLDYYSAELGIGPNCDIEGAILDKNVRLEEGVVIRPFPRGTEDIQESWQVRDGIVVLPKDTFIPAGMRIAPP
ncbi:MAG TPA: glucose-1-phosphate adenylyltransferase [Anaerolineales bacterium]|nr:glucose-1-phosphate adenylyltransferase [Anaerolineales bacterium]